MDEKKLFEKIRQDLVDILDEKRYRHTLGVVESAENLSKIYGENIEKARLAAILHDIAKQLDKDEIENIRKKYNIEFDFYQKKNHHLIHPTLAKYIARYEYEIEDEDILNAIQYHTTGRKDMSLLEKIVCLADYIEKNRKFDDVDEIRRLSKIDINYALYYALNGTLIHIEKNNEIIHPLTIEARNDLLCKFDSGLFGR